MGGVLSLQGAIPNREDQCTHDDPILGVQVLDGKQRSRGVEFSAADGLLPGWNVFAGYTFLDAKRSQVQRYSGCRRKYSLQGKVPQNVLKYSATLWHTTTFGQVAGRRRANLRR